MSPEQRKKLIDTMIDTRIQNIRNNSDEEYWMADVMISGWIGYNKYTDKELLKDANLLGVEVPK
ncbi:MAG TPA: hypothetical protein PK999_18210 [Nitrospira sp.]|nr:hypothetical protein [Nitrospira sp.]